MRILGLFLILTAAVAQEPLAHQKLMPTLWVQTSVEWRANCLQAYRTAKTNLDKARKNRSWTAATEQMGDYRKLPPAVVFDVDETVLDNSPGQARQVLKGSDFVPADFSAWVMEARATAIPGAAEFCRYAASRKVRVFFVTNRDVKEEAATRKNLQDLGFPLDGRDDAVLCRNERPDWNTSDKRTRRESIAAKFRILMLVGDDFGDFLPGVRTSIERRRELAAKYDSYWGERWVVLPNPGYGSWEQALLGDKPPADAAERAKARLALLKPE